MDLENITKAELDNLVEEAHKVFEEVLAKSQTEVATKPLNKDEEGSASHTPEGKTGSEASASTASPTPGAPPAGDSQAPGGAPDGSEAGGSPSACPTCGAVGAPSAGPSSDPGNAMADTGAQPDAGVQAAQPGQMADPAAQAQGVTPEQLAQEYAALDPQSLEAHFTALKQVIEAKMAQGAAPAPAAQAPAGAGPQGPAMGAPQGQPPMPPPGAMGKSETSAKELAELKKSIATLEAKNQELSKSFDTAVGVLEKLTKPMRKSLTGADVTPANAPKSLTVAEAKEKLNPLVRAGTLSKHDQDTVMSFYLGEIDVSKIQHLIK